MISVIIPFYNRFEFLDRAIKSVLSQIYQDIELILVDDFSDTEYKPIDSNKIKLFRNTSNLGPGLSRNIGMKKAQGDYVVFLDSDDYWHPYFLKKAIEKIEGNPEAIFAYALTMEVSLNKEVGYRRDYKTGVSSILPYIFTTGRPWCTSACLWNKKLLGSMQWVEYKTWEDYVFDVRAALVSNKVVCIEEPLVYYELSSDNKLSESGFKEKLSSLKMISDLLFNSKYRTKNEYIKPFLIKYISIISGFARAGDLSFFKENIKQMYQWTGNIIIHPIFVNLLYIHSLKWMRFALRNARAKITKQW